jgi:hypothetical protein
VRGLKCERVLSKSISQLHTLHISNLEHVLIHVSNPVAITIVV